MKITVSFKWIWLNLKRFDGGFRRVAPRHHPVQKPDCPIPLALHKHHLACHRRLLFWRHLLALLRIQTASSDVENVEEKVQNRDDEGGNAQNAVCRSSAVRFHQEAANKAASAAT